MNVIAITGRLTKDPELRVTASDHNVVSFTVAVRDPDVSDQTDFIDCVAWDKKAEVICNYFTKGQKIEVSGKLKTRLYEKDGVKHKATELNVKTVEFGESKKDADNDPAPEMAGFEPIGPNDSVPF